jgi:adenylyltransferase/sulfurtransferase
VVVVVTIILPAQLAALAGGTRTLQLAAGTLGDLLAALDARAPMLRSQLFEPEGAVRQFIGLFVDEQQIHEVGDGSLRLRAGCQLVVVSAVAGG